MLKEIDITGALHRLKDGSDKVCMIVPVTKETTVGELMQAKGFTLECTAKEPEEKPAKQKERKSNIDHGKIMALSKAGWTTSAIAQEVGCSAQTVINHINAEKEKAS